MYISIRQATIQDTVIVSDVLLEAALWLQERGIPLWGDSEVSPESISEDVTNGLFFIAEWAGEPAGTIKFQLEDLLFWPDISQEESAFLHRLAIRRHYSGGKVSSALLAWAVEHAQTFGKGYLRLDCDASRPRLRAVYEDFGFRHHSNRQVGAYFVSRYEYEIPPQMT
ncbi:Ribosomal protein S18 acetylase RimI and related acetyltransferases [Nostoc flagelliforme CCNUN1]|uniref:Ribosomal protein S18 acetylase RimI and related acetyltransferases n=1 Tax=Nostoc flagelliforme CCNUN1 TaxID=2038116 RepID=A0A2K8SV70_9NOSO|nr:GNAT family N-acetyltransferase [Nostoc flagelliforme]AUB38665.1 Ribosomal protein S18 acetylase RimI and related acetyltransferases [Nostoc flagelliforme CCNUN1]